MERAYTIQEIDMLRQACETRWLFGTTQLLNHTQCSRSFKTEEKDAGVEQLVRTYMMAGKTAEDIYAADRPKVKEQ